MKTSKNLGKKKASRVKKHRPEIGGSASKNKVEERTQKKSKPEDFSGSSGTKLGEVLPRRGKKDGKKKEGKKK